MKPFNPHDHFFSSLNQVENRLSSEQEQQDQPIPPHFSSPLFLTNPKSQHFTTTTSSNDDPPLDFLSNSPITNSQEEDPFASNNEEDVDDIERLMGLLGLSIPLGDNETDASFGCSGDGFYRNIVGVKGPRCETEMKRLDGWIDLYCKEKREPARLAHLIIGKAVALSDGGDGFEGVEFPKSVEEFLEHDPLED